MCGQETNRSAISNRSADKMKRRRTEIIPENSKCETKWEKCKECEFVGRSDNVKRHEETHLPKSERPRHICECGTAFSTKGALTRHKKFTCRLPKEAEHPSTEAEQPSTENAAKNITFDDFDTLEYVIGLKDGTSIRIPGMVEDIPKLLFAQGTF